MANSVPQQQLTQSQKEGRFANANWFARGALALTLLSLVIYKQDSGMAITAISVIFSIAGFGLGLYVLLSKNAPKTERWAAWAAVVLFAVGFISGIALAFVAAPAA